MSFKHSDLLDEFSDCPEISKILLEAQDSGLINEDTDELKANAREKAEKFSPFIDYWLENQYVMFKVEGVSLEEVGLDIFGLIDKSVNELVEFTYISQKVKGVRIVNREDYKSKVVLGLKSASFQVNITVPGIAKGQVKSALDGLINDIQNVESSMNIDRKTKPLLESFEKILKHPKVTDIKVSTDKNKNPTDVAPIVKEKAIKIEQSILSFEYSKVEEVDNSFEAEVFVFSTDTKDKNFKAYAEDMKIITFKCDNHISTDIWAQVKDNQLISINDFTKVNRIRVTGEKISSNSVKVEQIEVVK